MIPGLPADIDTIKGFLAEDEAQALYHYAGESLPLGPVLEVGSYCGKSTIYLGLAAKDQGSTVFALDHHRGSEEHQPGEIFHDPDLYDDSTDGSFAAISEKPGWMTPSSPLLPALRSQRDTGKPRSGWCSLMAGTVSRQH